MKTSSNRKPTKTPPPKGHGAGYKLGRRAVKPVPVDAVWMTSTQSG
jgi:hypothetical protein